jgi:quercetin dioxygenase-like cupin family protein
MEIDMNLKPIAFQAAVALLSFTLTSAWAEQATDTSWRTPADKVAWAATPFGVDASPVWGDMGNGPHMTLIHFAAGFATAEHTHSHDYAGVVVKGVMRHWIPGHPETQVDLAAGAVWSIPGNLPHVSECLSGEDCIAVLNQVDGFDFVETK